MSDDAWKRYAADFNSLTDEQVEREKCDAQDIVDEQEAWLEAIASWEAAGKPRSTLTHADIPSQTKLVKQVGRG